MDDAFESWCPELEEGVWLATPCDEDARRYVLWFSSNDVRRRAGAVPCWWHASVEDVERIRGITWPWAALAVKLRNEGLARSLADLAAHASMGARGRRIAEAFTEDCADEPKLARRRRADAVLTEGR